MAGDWEVNMPEHRGKYMTTRDWEIEFDEPIDASEEAAVTVLLALPTGVYESLRRSGGLGIVDRALRALGDARYRKAPVFEQDDRAWYAEDFEAEYEYAREARSEGTVTLRARAFLRCRSTTGRPIM